MKILIVNTSNRGGGAAIAAVRLKTALLNLGEKPRMLVATKEGNDFTTFGLKSAWRYKLCWAFERLGIFLRQGLSKAHLWDIDPATHGVDITALPEFKEADIIHLHWVNQGFLSFKILNKVLHSSKPVVWTMHDAWTFTGLCHSPLECTAFRRECGNCMLLLKITQILNPVLAAAADDTGTVNLFSGNGEDNMIINFMSDECPQNGAILVIANPRYNEYEGTVEMADWTVLRIMRDPTVSTEG